MVAVLDDFARRTARSLIEQYGDCAFGCAVGRAKELEESGDLLGAGLWEIIALEITQLRRSGQPDPWEAPG
jgi:hypothetical protein